MLIPSKTLAVILERFDRKLNTTPWMHQASIERRNGLSELRLIQVARCATKTQSDLVITTDDSQEILAECVEYLSLSGNTATSSCVLSLLSCNNDEFYHALSQLHKKKGLTVDSYTSLLSIVTPVLGCASLNGKSHFLREYIHLAIEFPQHFTIEKIDAICEAVLADDCNDVSIMNLVNYDEIDFSSKVKSLIHQFNLDNNGLLFSGHVPAAIKRNYKNISAYQETVRECFSAEKNTELCFKQGLVNSDQNASRNFAFHFLSMKFGEQFQKDFRWLLYLRLPEKEFSKKRQYQTIEALSPEDRGKLFILLQLLENMLKITLDELSAVEVNYTIARMLQYLSENKTTVGQMLDLSLIALKTLSRKNQMEKARCIKMVLGVVGEGWDIAQNLLDSLKYFETITQTWRGLSFDIPNVRSRYLETLVFYRNHRQARELGQFFATIDRLKHKGLTLRDNPFCIYGAKFFHADAIKKCVQEYIESVVSINIDVARVENDQDKLDIIYGALAELKNEEFGVRLSEVGSSLYSGSLDGDSPIGSYHRGAESILG